MQKIKRAFEECNNCYIFSVNNTYVSLLAVALQSLCSCADKSELYDIIVLHTDITEYNKLQCEKLAHSSLNISIRFYDIKEIRGNENFYTENRKSFTEEAYYRLFTPWIVDESYEKALYFDADIILRKNPNVLFNEDLTDVLIAAVRDYWGICNCYIPDDDLKAYRESIGIEEIDTYVISATVLFNLMEFRKQYTLNDMHKKITEKCWRQHDQDIINIMCQRRIKILSPTWGWMTDYGNNHYLPQYLQDELSEIEMDPSAVHFAAGRKPYLMNYIDYDMLFWKHADQTPYFSMLLDRIKNWEYRNYVAYEVSCGNLEEHPTNDGIMRSYKGITLENIRYGHCRYRRIEIKNGKLYLEGMVGFFGVSPHSDIDVKIIINGERYPATRQLEENGYVKEKDTITYRGESFRFIFPLRNSGTYWVTIAADLNGIEFIKDRIGFEQFAPLRRQYENIYYTNENWVITSDRKRLRICKVNDKELRNYEKEFRKELLVAHRKSVVMLRFVTGILTKLKQRPIWLISDRLLRGDDNGEVFFRYINANHKKDVNAYYVIEKSCSDYVRMKQYGKVVAARSIKHKILQLLADYCISSQTDTVFRNPFKNSGNPFCDIINKTKFVFLQHGIINTDISDWLMRRKQAFHGFITSTKKEYQSVIQGEYDYSEEVWLTGLARFDLLEDDCEKIITILPTWRKYLAIKQDMSTGTWSLKHNFAQSRYACFYRDLLNSERLNKEAKRLGYSVQFKVHPSFLTHEKEFEIGDNVKIITNDISYRSIFSKSSLIVTDYSSSIYDFIYLRKPIIYAQFDADDFFNGTHQCKKSDFDFEKEGYGEVEYSLEATIDRIIEYMQCDCKMKDKYKKRVDELFCYSDKKNCERIYNKIMTESL